MISPTFYKPKAQVPKSRFKKYGQKFFAAGMPKNALFLTIF